MADDKNFGNDRVIDLKKRLSDDEMAYAVQAFLEKYTPLWFQWLSWIVLVGGISYLAEYTGSKVLKFVVAFSFGVLLLYWGYFFASIRIQPYHSWALSKSRKISRFLAMLPGVLFACVLSFGVIALADFVSKEIRLERQKTLLMEKNKS